MFRYRLHPKVVALTGWLESRLAIGPGRDSESFATARRSLTTAAVIAASFTIFYLVPTYFEILAAPYIGSTLAVFLIGNLLGCVAVSLIDWRIALAVYTVNSLFEFALMRFAGVRAGELAWFSDMVPTVIIVGHILLARTQEPQVSEAPGDESVELTSWKAIADYLDINVRTAQRWEQEHGLPVRRFSGEKGRVIAATADLEHWKKVNLHKPNWWGDLSLLRFCLVTSTVLLFATAGWSVLNYLSERRLGPPSRLLLEDSQIIVRDSAGRQLWTHQFPEPPLPGDARHAFWFGHLTTKTNTDTLYVYRPERMVSSELYCFSEKGETRWKFTPGHPVSDTKLDYPPVYFINSFKVLGGTLREQTRIVVISNHGWSYPNQVAVLGPDGKLEGEYWHSGHLSTMMVDDSIADKTPKIILGGVDSGRLMASMVVLDAGRVRGADHQEANSPFHLKGFEPGSEEVLVWFKRSCLNEGAEPFNYVTEVALVPGGMQVVVREASAAEVYIVYVLDKNYNVTYLEPSSGFQARHWQMEHDGKLGHSLNDNEIEKLRQIEVIHRSTALEQY